MSEFRTEDVERGTELVSEIGGSKWELGDLAHQVCPATNGDKDGRLTRFADEIDIGAETLRVYRRVAEAWQLGTRIPGCSWTVHRELAPHPDRCDIIAEQPFDQDGVACDRWTLRGIRHRLQRPAFDRSAPPRKPTVEPPDLDPGDLPDLRPPPSLPWDALVEGRRLGERLISLRIEMESWFDRSPERDDRRAILDVVGPALEDWRRTFDRRTTEVMEAATWS